MIMAVSGSPSAIKDSTYQQNRDQMPDLTFRTKGQLRKDYELLFKEKKKLQEKLDKHLDESLYFKARCIELNAEIERLTTVEDVNYLRAV